GDGALFVTDAAVVSARHQSGGAGTVARELVEPGGEPLREPPRVGEDDRRAMRVDEGGDPVVEQRPHARGVSARLGHVLSRYDDLDADGLLGGWLDHGDGSPAGEEG